MDPPLPAYTSRESLLYFSPLSSRPVARRPGQPSSRINVISDDAQPACARRKSPAGLAALRVARKGFPAASLLSPHLSRGMGRTSNDRSYAGARCRRPVAVVGDARRSARTRAQAVSGY
ncbi:hypothetical protein P5V15_015644 [Pogonomyrmex californicus]